MASDLFTRVRARKGNTVSEREKEEKLLGDLCRFDEGLPGKRITGTIGRTAIIRLKKKSHVQAMWKILHLKEKPPVTPPEGNLWPVLLKSGEKC